MVSSVGNSSVSNSHSALWASLLTHTAKSPRVWHTTCPRAFTRHSLRVPALASIHARNQQRVRISSTPPRGLETTKWLLCGLCGCASPECGHTVAPMGYAYTAPFGWHCSSYALIVRPSSLLSGIVAAEAPSAATACPRPGRPLPYRLCRAGRTVRPCSPG